MNEIEREQYAELAVAGSILLDARCMEDMNYLRENDFQVSYCRVIYHCARELEKAGAPIDPVTILDYASRHGLVLSRETLAELMQVTPTVQNAASYAEIVHTHAVSRSLQAVGQGLLQSAGCAPADVLAGVRRELDALDAEVEEKKFICAADVKPGEPDFLIAPYFPMGKGTMIQAEPGVGKTALACLVAAHVSNGKDLAGLKVNYPGNVLFLSTEDSHEVLSSRLEADGADRSKIYFLNIGTVLGLNSPEIAAMIRKLKATLVVFDPLQAFFGGKVDMYRPNETREALARLYAMCARNHCACIIVSHLSKTTKEKSPVNQSLGSVDISGAQRSILHVMRDPNHPGDLLAFHIKSSDSQPGRTIRFAVKDRGGVEILGFTDMEIGDLYAEKPDSDGPVEDDPAAKLLSTLLSDDPRGKFYSYEEIADAFQHSVGYNPYSTARELRAHLEAPRFRSELKEKLGISVAFKKNSGVRGILLTHCPKDAA